MNNSWQDFNSRIDNNYVNDSLGAPSEVFPKEDRFGNSLEGIAKNYNVSIDLISKPSDDFSSSPWTSKKIELDILDRPLDRNVGKMIEICDDLSRDYFKIDLEPVNVKINLDLSRGSTKLTGHDAGVNVPISGANIGGLSKAIVNYDLNSTPGYNPVGPSPSVAFNGIGMGGLPVKVGGAFNNSPGYSLDTNISPVAHSGPTLACQAACAGVPGATPALMAMMHP